MHRAMLIFHCSLFRVNWLVNWHHNNNHEFSPALAWSIKLITKLAEPYVHLFRSWELLFHDVMRLIYWKTLIYKSVFTFRILKPYTFELRFNFCIDEIERGFLLIDRFLTKPMYDRRVSVVRDWIGHVTGFWPVSDSSGQKLIGSDVFYNRLSFYPIQFFVMIRVQSFFVFFYRSYPFTHRCLITFASMAIILRYLCMV